MNPDEISNATRLDFANQLANAQTAESVVREMQRVYQLFLQSVNPDEDVFARFSMFGSGSILIDEIVAASPALVLMFGTNEAGDPVRILQHVSQFSVLLYSAKRRPPDPPRQPMGFG